MAWFVLIWGRNEGAVRHLSNLKFSWNPELHQWKRGDLKPRKARQLEKYLRSGGIRATARDEAAYTQQAAE